MQSQTYGDKQREAQQRKRQEELWARANKGLSRPAESPADEPVKVEESTPETGKNKGKPPA